MSFTVLLQKHVPNTPVQPCLLGLRESGLYSQGNQNELLIYLFDSGRLNYVWIHQGGKQATLPAPTYIDYVMASIQNLIDDEKIFPTKSSMCISFTSHERTNELIVLFLKKDQAFHPSFPATIRTVYRQLLRVFAHVYHAHYQQILHLRSEPHFNSLFAHFLAFGREYELLEVRDIKGEPNNPVGVGLLWERWKESGILES